ncbi:MAG: DUF4838 domain-containing protein [Saprospiraceae bacterium]|nr:DUF4838 domain-containing protein [Saprospiraceae bacterium]
MRIACLLYILIYFSCARRNIAVESNVNIIIPSKASRSIILASNQLVFYLDRLGLGKAKIVIEPQANNKLNILLLDNREAILYGLDTLKFAHGGFYIRSKPGEVILAGNCKNFVPIEPYGKSRSDMANATAAMDRLTGHAWENVYAAQFKSYSQSIDLWEQDERGILNATFKWLELLGVRWYAPGSGGEVLPDRKFLKIPETDGYFKPAFAVRNMGFSGKRFFQTSSEDILWMLRLKLNRAPEIIGRGMFGHGTSALHSRPEIRDSKPLYFGVFKGNRDNSSRNLGKPCLSSIELKRDNVNYGKFLYNHFGEKTISVMPTDAYGEMCECELCKGKGTPEKGFEGSMSDYVWSYVNDVATELYRTHPERKVLCFAYGSYLLPPQKIKKLSPNLLVGICRTRTDLLDPVNKIKFENIMDAWAELTANKFIMYDYYLHNKENTATATFPVVFPHLIAEDLDRIKDRIDGEFIEVYRMNTGFATDTAGLAINHINVYFTAQKYWDPQMSTELFLEEYFRLYYENASSEMKEFFTLAENNWLALDKNPELISQMLDILRRAKVKSNNNQKVESRIALIQDQVEPLRALAVSRNRPDTRDFNLRAARRESKDLLFDGKVNEKYWQDLFGYKYGDNSNLSTFKMSWITDTLVIGFRHDTTKPGKDRSVRLDLETTSESTYKIRVFETGKCEVTDFAGKLLSVSPITKTTMTSKSWEAEIKIPMSREKKVVLDGSKFYGRWADATFPWYFNISTRDQGVDSQYYTNPVNPKDLYNNLVSVIIR